MSKQGEIDLSWYDTETEEDVEHTFPAKMEVCQHCEGYGTHLTPSIGNHAYTSEEFHESFDEEEAEEYFRRGGRYDVTCHTCKGNKVVPAVDESRLTEDQKKLYADYQKSEEARFRSDEEDRQTRYYESGGYDY